jgi:hypothetical protein
MTLSRYCLAPVAIVFFAIAALAQNFGSISGMVRDQSGALVPGAAVTASNKATGVTTRVVSLTDGQYLFTSLVPGNYDVSVEAPGFARYVRPDIEVHVSDKLMLDIALQVGESREAVTVSAEAPQLRTEDAQRGEVINNNFISHMPQLNRDPFALLSLAGNVQGSGTAVELNGGRTSAIDYYIDGGVVNTGQANRLTNQTPSMDAVSEFKVVTSGVSAEFGRISGGYVTLVTKSGTNTFHGSAYEYMYNDMFNANSWAQNAAGARKAHFRQNDFGFTLGGPVTVPKVYNGKNRTFFFVDNEYLKRNQAGTVTLSSVPNDAERNGDFSQTLYQGKSYPMYDPYGPQVFNTSNGLWERTGLLGGDGKHVPANLISPVSKAILKMIPQSNRPSVAGSSSLNNYSFASGSNQDNFRFGVRMDHNITSAHRLSMRYTRYDANLKSTPVMDTPLYTSNITDTSAGLNANLNYTWTARPTVIVDFRNSVTHSPAFSGGQHPAGFTNSFLPAVYAQYLGSNDIPGIGNTFMSGTDYGQAGASSVTNSTSYNFAASVTKILNHHTLKFGGEHRRYYDNFLNAGGATNTVRFMVDPLYRFQGDWGLNANEGRILGLGSFLLGINDRNNIAKPTTRAMNTNYNGMFVQDDWKVTPKLTLNLGIRWDDERPTTERQDKLYFWDPGYASLFKINPGYNFQAELAKAGLPTDAPVPGWVKNGAFDPGAVLIANTPQFPSRTPQILNHHQFAPRVGLAYQITKDTVLRASGGKMYLPTTGNPNSYATSNSNVALSDQAFAGWHASTDGGRTYISTWDNPFPLPSMFTNYTRDVLTANLQSSLDPGATVVSRELRMPREYDWAIDIQRQLPLKLVLEVGYAGNRGLGLLATDTISHYPKELLVPKYAAMMQGFMLSPNAGQTLETTITGTTQQLGLLEYQYPFYGRVQVSGLNEGRSSYHAMNVRAERRFHQGLSVLLNYTYGRLLDDVGGADGQGAKTVQSVDSFRAAWGLSPLDRTHRLNLAYTYEFPVGKGKHWLTSPSGWGGRILDRVVGGWQLAGNYSYVNGNPVILTGSTTSNINNTIKVNQSWGSYATSDHNLTSPNYFDDKQVLYSPVDPISASSIRRLDPSKVVGAQAFISGNLSPTDGRYRNPPLQQMDISLMKNFYLGESRYVQFRAEGQNAFNFRGFGPYNSQIAAANYGLITTAGNQSRQIQLSARINF